MGVKGWITGLWFLVSCECTMPLASAAPYTPGSATEVVEKLPNRANTPELKKVDRLKKQLALQSAQNSGAAEASSTALALAQAYFELAMSTGEPRYIGYARAVIEPRFAAQQGQADWWLMSALLTQYTHQFGPAHTQLDKALQLQPDHAGAWSWKSALYMVEGRYTEAVQACESLKPHASALTYAACAEYAKSGLGQLGAAYANLNKQFAADGEQASPGLRVWVLIRLAEMAERLGQSAQAEQWYTAALKVASPDQYLLGAYADFLLHQGRAAEVLILLKGWEASDVLLMRMAQAAHKLGDPLFARYKADLRERFNAMSRRGEQLHEQEEARLLLFFENQSSLALEKAAHNYSVLSQREPRDLEILLQAAVANRLHAGNSPVIAQVHQWVQTTGFEDTRLKALLDQTRAPAAAHAVSNASSKSAPTLVPAPASGGAR